MRAAGLAALIGLVIFARSTRKALRVSYRVAQADTGSDDPDHHFAQ